MFGTKQLWWILQRWLQFVHYFCCQPQVPATADIQFYVRGLKPDEKYMAAVAAYNAHGKLIGGSIGLTCRPVLAAHPLPTLMAWGYLAQVRDKLTAWQITLVNRVFTLNTVQKRRCGRSSLIWRGEIWGETYEFWFLYGDARIKVSSDAGGLWTRHAIFHVGRKVAWRTQRTVV